MKSKDNIEIIYEDEHILAVNKPAGLVVHPDGRTKEETLTDWILSKYPDLLDVGEPLVLANGEEIKRPGIVHRLDRETTGVLVIAKNNEAFSFLKEQFQSRSVEKHYNAFIYGHLKDDKGVVDLSIGKSRGDFRLWSAERGARGELREAITEYKVLEKGKEASFLEITPKTGRTHQIRVHMKALQHPVVCDKRYAPKRDCILGFTRLALHAREITLKTPSGVQVTLEAELPLDFLNALEELKQSNLAQ